MTRRKKLDQPEPVVPTPEERNAALDKVRHIYEEWLNDEMGHLHNRFVAFIAESRLPLPQALLVIKMLEAEIMDQATKKYLGA